MSALRTIRQFVPAVYPRDAVGGQVLRLSRELGLRGFDAPVFVEETRPETAAHTRPVSALGPVDPHAVNVYHMATGSAVVETLIARSEPLVTVHHNLTPLELMAPWDPEQVHQLTLARRQLESLARSSRLGIGDSEYNRLELERLGFASTAVAPIVFDPPSVSRAEHSTGRNSEVVLFVGRIAPNKAQHDLIKAIALLVQQRPSVQLRLVGASASDRYKTALERMVAGLELARNVVFVGPVDDAQLEVEYAQADVLCCLSDHEGFGVPLIEAMARRLPVVAYASSAVPETVDGAALLLPVKDPATVSTALDRVLGSPELAASLAAAGSRRAEAFSADRAVDAFLAALELLDAVTSEDAL